MKRTTLINHINKVNWEINDRIHCYGRDNCEGSLSEMINIKSRLEEKWQQVEDAFKDAILEKRVSEISDPEEAEEYKDFWYCEDEFYKLSKMDDKELFEYVCYLDAQAEIFFEEQE